jgi:hypothetical protein
LCIQFGLLELDQPQNEGISLDVNSDPICSYMLSMYKPAYPTCVTVEENTFPFTVIIIVGRLLKGPIIQPLNRVTGNTTTHYSQY